MWELPRRPEASSGSSGGGGRSTLIPQVQGEGACVRPGAAVRSQTRMSQTNPTGARFLSPPWLP